MSGFCPWNEREIVILGGANDEFEKFGDGWIFDTVTETIRQVIRPYKNSFKFNVNDNQCYMTRQNSLLALATVEKTGLFEFDRDSN